MAKTIRWGIIGLGNIAQKFAQDLALVEDGELVAIASRSMSKALNFNKEFHVMNVFDSYEELFECATVDVVYIATPHTEHMNWAILAMQNGKHVLCEKPMGVNGKQLSQMLETAKKQKVFLMEALWSRFNPTIRKIKEIVDEGGLGALEYIHADFAFYALDRAQEGRLLNPNLAGGSLLDIGIYPVFLTYLLLGVPDKITARSSFHETGAEIQTSMMFDYKNAHAVLYSGLTSNSRMQATVSGTKGAVFIDPRWHETEGYTIVNDTEEEHISLPKLGKGYTYEINEVHECIRNNKLESELWSHANSMELIEILDAIRKQLGISFPFEA
ncbi:MAG: Gfo/Idh/MocA family oxidoreductase [Muriicola sp.]|nr:Gfo/Idh/MocA family oxidoreductase [Muriicola sp.]